MKPICAFIGTADDKDYLPKLKGMFNGCAIFILYQPITMLSHLDMYCAKRQITSIVTTSPELLRKLVELQGNPVSNPSIDNYAGSVFTYGGREILFINPLRQLFTVSYGSFITKRFISKLVDPTVWTESTDFTWELITATNVESIYAQLSQAFAIAADIETFKNPLSIRCIGYSGVYISSNGNISTRSFVLPLDSQFALAYMRKINDLPVPKIFQKGTYDNSYLLRYNAPCRSYFWDTANLMHSWYAELPKDLAFLNAFFLRKVVYWKDLAETNDLFEYYKYNALDTWATANVWIAQMLTMPDWARRNYLLEFPVKFPNILAGMTGIKRDMEAMYVVRKEVDEEEAIKLDSLRRMLKLPAFNPGSHVQVKDLLKLLGCDDIDSSSAIDIAKAKVRHPLNARILSLISVAKDDDDQSIRGLRKLRSTYLRTDDDAVKTGIHAGEKGSKEFKGRVLYSINEDGTDSGRNSSREHAFWTGLQIQNIPVGKTIKQTLCADDGFFIGECDLEKAESWDTAYISGDKNLIVAVNSPADFHSTNASAFFGIPYSDIYDDAKKKTKNKPLRDLSKRTNHGANYNMGPDVLVDTMGVDKVWTAGKMLGLQTIEPRRITMYLLEQFHKTYPDIKGKYYVHVINEIGTSSKLVSRAYHHTEYNCKSYEPVRYISEGDWTRYCFGKPDKNKLDLNSYVSHGPQSLNGRTLNEAWMRVFYEIALPNPMSFRLYAQVHDSILFSYKNGFDYLATAVKNCMEIPVTIRDVSGVIRTFTVPASLKLGTNNKTTGLFVPAKYWSETE